MRNVMSGLNEYSGRRCCVGSQVRGAPVPGSGWLASIVLMTLLERLPTYPAVMDERAPIKYSANVLNCCVNCGRICEPQDRSWPETLASGCEPCKPVA